MIGVRYCLIVDPGRLVAEVFELKDGHYIKKVETGAAQPFSTQ